MSSLSRFRASCAMGLASLALVCGTAHAESARVSQFNGFDPRVAYSDLVGRGIVGDGDLLPPKMKTIRERIGQENAVEVAVPTPGGFLLLGLGGLLALRRSGRAGA